MIMKKHFVCLMALLLCLSSCIAIAEDFSLRNGIVFGDTMDDILKKETSLTRQSDTSNWFDGRIAGFDDASCGFYFDDAGKLVSMDYSFDSDINTSRDTTNSNYETLYKSLVRKYGSPEGNTGGSVELITGPAIDRMSLYVYLIGAMDGYSGNYIDYDEWIVDVDDHHVKIDLISYYYRDSDYEYFYQIDLSYHMYTDADYQAELEENQKEREEVDNDL